ncbi:MAG: hypothetical protein F4Y74_14760 [Gemmatimonadales bacterium]|nr:hypothetical protein [Gemmatimonadales bacterium]MYG20419.1 hypothetical protein [Gemmatimonadales bacterium]
MISQNRSSSVTPSPPNRELVVYGLEQAGGGVRRMHTEDVALKCHELFPDAFSWTRHPRLPDKDIVRVALTDARKEQYGALVTGRAGQTRRKSAKTNPDGWMLTEAGVAFVKKHGARLASFARSGNKKDHRQTVLKQLRRIKEHQLFRQYRDEPDGFHAPIGQLADLMRCRVDAESPVWRRRFESARLVIAASDDEELIDFLRKLERSYQDQSVGEN